MDAKLNKINKEIDCLIDDKCKLEGRVLKIIKEVDQVVCKIDKAEAEVEKALCAKLSKECQERIRCEIARLKQQLKRAEKILCRYDLSLKQLCKQLKICAGQGDCKKA